MLTALQQLYKQRVALVAALLLHGLLATAQSPETQALLTDLQERYSNLEDFSADMEVAVFGSDDAKEPFMVETTHVRKAGPEFLYKSERYDMLYKERSVLLVDHASKQIVRQQHAKQKAKQPAELPDPTAMLQNVDSVTQRTEPNGDQTLVVYNHDSPIQISYWYLNSEGWIEAVHYYYNKELFPETPKVEITYNNLDTSPSFASDLFAESAYVQRHGKQLQPQARYQHYQIMTPYE